ncbi:hypothetical protein [Cylindrospermum stagnale]|nr:hypothetical protein [Cylindrospermum stagnale]
MSQILMLELSEQALIAIQQQAKSIGISPERLAITLLEQHFAQSLPLPITETKKALARAKFERHFGTLNLDIVG